jgi:hypothetical protein
MKGPSKYSQHFFILCLVTLWFYANGQYGFSLKFSAKLFREPENFLYLLWVLYLVSWILPLGTAVLLSVSRIFVEEKGDREEEGVKGLIENRDTIFVLWPWPNRISESPPDSNGILVLLVSHWVGISFTALAFVVGSISTVQVLKSFAPLFTAVFAMCYLNATLPRKAIIAVSDPLYHLFPCFCNSLSQTHHSYLAQILFVGLGVSLSMMKNSSFT